MKIGIILILFVAVFHIANGQVQTKSFLRGDAFEQIQLIREHQKANKIIKLASFDVQKLIDEDKLNEGMARPFRFGKGFDVDISLTDGEWVDVENGRLWSMEFQSSKAYSINFVFDQFFLSDNAILYIANASGTNLYGPVSSKQNTKNGYFLTDLIQGDNVTIYLYEPNREKGKSKLTIKRIVHAYKGSYPDSYGNFNGSYSCNNDINCYSDWDDESDAVGLVLLSDGTEWCSGSLLMTANQSFLPYFLSAFHCIDSTHDENLTASEISNAENWMFKFQYKKASCGGSTATTGVTYNGATFRSAWASSDFLLMELNNAPLGDTQFSWLGWDRSGNTPTSGTGIHHPAGDVMKISFDTNQLSSNSTQINWTGGTISPINTHWVVGFDNGTAQGGSSGSPLFDQNSRVVGQLHGGQDGCAPITKYYGRFNNSWTGGGTNATRLSNWLDPCASGAVTTNTTRSPYLSGPSIVCSSGAAFTITNLPPVNSIVWTSGPNLTISSGQNSASCTFSATGYASSWVTAMLVTDCGSITLPQVAVWAGGPQTPVISGPGGIHCGDQYSFSVAAQSSVPETTYFWDSAVLEIEDGNLPTCKVSGYFNGNKTLSCTVTACGVSKTASKTVNVNSCDLLLFSPNPATDQTIVSIESGTQEDGIIADGWDMEVYDQGQLLKTKKIQLKNRTTTLNTSGWKDGVYIVRAIIGGEVISEKLVVKH